MIIALFCYLAISDLAFMTDLPRLAQCHIMYQRIHLTSVLILNAIEIKCVCVCVCMCACARACARVIQIRKIGIQNKEFHFKNDVVVSIPSLKCRKCMYESTITELSEIL